MLSQGQIIKIRYRSSLSEKEMRNYNLLQYDWHRRFTLLLIANNS